LSDETDDDFDITPYLDMTDEEVADMVLMLLLEETAQKRLARFDARNSAGFPMKSTGNSPATPIDVRPGATA
jgi:hypothetical protein